MLEPNKVTYLKEWADSGVDEELTRLNVVATDGTAAYDCLFYSSALSRRNDGRLRTSMLRRYQHIEAGGWWCSGVDVLAGEPDLWGCFKPDRPRTNDRGKPIKYEHPPKASTGLFALRVPPHLWEAIADRAGVAFDRAEIDSSQPDGGFWQWIARHPQVPLCITEGAKKAGSLLSAGYAAVALPGVHNGYRSPKDEWGNRIGKSHLIPQLQVFAVPNRPIYIVFDRDNKPQTIRAVNSAIRRLGYLLGEAGSQVRIVAWEVQQGKGVDDFIANCGREAFDRAYETALPFDTWKANSHAQLTYPADVPLCHRYLPTIAIPDRPRLVAVRSPKGTGKTEWISQVVKGAIASGQKVLVIGHRVQLVESLCRRFGISYRGLPLRNSEFRIQNSKRETEEVSSHQDYSGTKIKVEPSQECYPVEPSSKGMGLCIDSLHGNSQLQFNPYDWQDALVVIDEIEQVLWHALNGDTCRQNRVAILKSLKTLMQQTIASRGRVVIADADLSDISIDYLTALAGVKTSPYIIDNTWKPDETQSWPVYHYDDTTPRRLVKDLERHIKEGGKPFVCLSAQKLKSRWSTRSLEAYFQQQFPDLKILRIDGESIADPEHPACGCISYLNNIGVFSNSVGVLREAPLLGKYDMVLASPAIETGVSIDIKGHFTSVWCIANGIQSDSSVRQSLARVRDTVPRYLWAATRGFNQVGNGSSSIPDLMSSGQQLTQTNIRLLQQSDLSTLDDFDVGFQAESLLCWAKIAVRLNAGMSCYRETIAAQLATEGHQIVEAGTEVATPNSSKKETLTDAITAVQTCNYLAECQAIVKAPDLHQRQYRSLRKKMVKTEEERRSLRKYELQRRYGIPVTISTIEQDDRGWYEALRLHYFLTVGRPFLGDRDRRMARACTRQGQLFQPDFNRSQLGAIVSVLDVLGLPVLLEYPQRELRNTDADLQAMAKMALEHRSQIKTIVGIGLAKNSTPIVILRRFLDKIACGLVNLRRERVDKKYIRVYQLNCPDDDRDRVFQHWLNVDRALPGLSESAIAAWGRSDCLVSDLDNPYVQLALEL